MKTQSPKFKFTRNVRHSKLHRDADILLEAVVKAIRDRKGRKYLEELVRVYPVILNGGNPYRTIFDEAFRLRQKLVKILQSSDDWEDEPLIL